MPNARTPSVLRLLLCALAFVSMFGTLSPSHALAQTSRPWLGVVLAPAADGVEGVPITEVMTGSPAEQARLAVGDRIVAVSGRTVATAREVIDRVRALSPGDVVPLTFVRGGKRQQAHATVTVMPSAEALLRMARVGKPAPELVSIQPVPGSATIRSMAALRGRVVLVEFWAPWCTACRMASPQLNEWTRMYAARGLTVVGVGAEPAAELADAARTWGLAYPIVSDPAQATWKAWGVREIPAMLLVDRRGVVRDVVSGFDPARFRELQAAIDRLIAEPAR
ncbi:MAG TPA: redoxin domain-containing protein [Polyangiaceae bacterium]|nr:redoxin domain-containing protein [Polyangiaceae bacterium]